MMRILHFIPSIDRTSGGVGVYMQLLAKKLGMLCDLYIATAISEYPLFIEHAQVITIPSNWKQYYAMKTVWKKMLDEIHPDVVHVNCCWMPQSAWTQKWAQQAGYKVVLTPHGMLEPWIISRHYWTRKVPALWLYQKQAVVDADYLHATAESEKQNLLRLGYNDRIAVIANGIDVEEITMKTCWKRKKTILFLSRIHVKKGIEFLLEAVAALKAQLYGYTVRIAGEGEENYIRQLQERVQQLDITEMIDFCGGVYGDKKWELFREADLFVLPTYSENFGIVVAEALACGTPVLTTKGTPWAELESENCGWWIDLDKSSMVKALLSFLECTENELESMGQKGRKLVEAKYSTGKIAMDMMNLYRKVINES
mgnify:CR=1 FL=1